MGRMTPDHSFPSTGQSQPLVSPLYHSAVYTLPDLDTLDLIMNQEREGYIYARDGHPNANKVIDILCQMENADWGAVCSSGMAAISSAIIAVVQQGDRIVASDQLYGKTTQLLRDEMSRFGVETTFVDTNDLEAVEAALEEECKIVLVETISNPLLRIADIPNLAKLCKRHKTMLFVDNTFATPVLFRPLSAGADMVLESMTKMIGGHSDVTLGAVCGQGDLQSQVAPVVSTWGFAANPFDCWMAERGMWTLDLRMKTACKNAKKIAKWLLEQSSVSRVIYPGLEDHADHELAAELFGNEFGNMLCFELKGGRAAVNHFIHNVPEIPFSPSLGHVTTTLSHPALTSHRYVSPAQKRRMGITDGLIRLSVGVEDVQSTIESMEKGM